jgi:alanine racemase
MTRPAQVVINLAALRYNYSRVCSLAPNSKIISVVKADAYGHGLIRVARELNQTYAFGVACIDEARELREAGIDKPIILLEGPYSPAEFSDIEKMNFEIVIHHHDQIKMIEQSDISIPIKTWIKIDSGMHRLGFFPTELELVRNRLRDCIKVNPDISLMTHLANASESDSNKTINQLAIFNKACASLSGKRSIANSAGVLAWPDTHADFVRPGLMLYGISPMENSTASDHDLKPVMTLQSKLISIKTIQKGESVGYGADWYCPETMQVGIVAAGYGDGFPRHANSGTPILINGVLCQVIGNPSMDMITVDLRKLDTVNVGDTVELWGVGLPVERIANHAGTIPYELVCGVHKRLQVVVNDQG